MITNAELATLNQYHYLLSDGTEKEKEKALRRSNRLGYDIESATRGVAHFKKRDTGDNVITVKGTNIGQTKDLKSDWSIASGTTGTDKQFTNRQKQVDTIYNNAEGKKILTGHSLGGSQAISMLIKSQNIRDKTHKAVVFNPGSSPFFHKELKPHINKEVTDKLNKKLNIHHTKGDLISAPIVTSEVGKIKKHKAKSILNPHSLSNYTESSK